MAWQDLDRRVEERCGPESIQTAIAEDAAAGGELPDSRIPADRAADDCQVARETGLHIVVDSSAVGFVAGRAVIANVAVRNRKVDRV